MRIYEVLKHQGMNSRAVADCLGITAAAVSATINGKNHSSRVLDYLSFLGVPEEYLCDPRKKEWNVMKVKSPRTLYSEKIHKELKNRGMTVFTIARALRVAPSAVSAVITGKSDSYKILNYFQFIGIPEEYLCDPRKTKE